MTSKRIRQRRRREELTKKATKKKTQIKAIITLSTSRTKGAFGG